MLDKIFSESNSQTLMKLVAVGLAGFFLFFTTQSKLNSMSIQLEQAFFTQKSLSDNLLQTSIELKETNKELQKLREAVIEIQVEMRSARGSRNAN